jgi:hypothetical protein
VVAISLVSSDLSYQLLDRISSYGSEITIRIVDVLN